MQADYIIVGGGTAGSVLAARLSEDGAKRVLLLEAGPDARGWRYRVPAGTMKLIGDAQTDWRLAAAPDSTLNGRRPLAPAGRMLGGSSAMNGMVYVRGLRGDFDLWARDCPGWSFGEVLPYFMKSETFDGPASPARGRHGPQQVSAGRAFHNLAGAFIRASAEAGLPTRGEYCAGDQEGAFAVNGTVTRRGLRSGAADAYLRPAMGRRNLVVRTGVTAQSLVFVDGRATGVRILGAAGIEEHVAAAEIIVCCGAFGSPALLLRSGIGPASELAALGVPILRDLPGVGRNLREHLGAGVSKLVNVGTYNSPLGPLQYLRHGLDYLFRARGPLATSVVQAMAYGRSDASMASPDYMLSFLPFCVDYRASPPALHRRPGVHIGANICRPHSQGRVSLASPDPAVPPCISYQLLSDPRDITVLTAALRKTAEIFAASAFAPYLVANNVPAVMPATDAQWEEHMRSTGGPSYHPVGTCRMGSDPLAVLDAFLRVRGVERLRVVDASVMPTTTSGNTAAPVMMIAEKAAEIIRSA